MSRRVVPPAVLQRTLRKLQTRLKQIDLQRDQIKREINTLSNELAALEAPMRGIGWIFEQRLSRKAIRIINKHKTTAP
jgi:uncharacterized protein (DUF3084 family)